MVRVEVLYPPPTTEPIYDRQVDAQHFPSLGGRGDTLFDMSRLDPETYRLLWLLVEAARAVPRSQRGDFMALRHLGGNLLQHPGLPDGVIRDFDEGDSSLANPSARARWSARTRGTSWWAVLE